MYFIPIVDTPSKKWAFDFPEPTKRWVCSKCKGVVETAYYCNCCYYNYCPNCGAMVDKDEREDKE